MQLFFPVVTLFFNLKIVIITLFKFHSVLITGHKITHFTTHYVLSNRWVLKYNSKTSSFFKIICVTLELRFTKKYIVSYAFGNSIDSFTF
jgi:hypothetical protein